MSSNRTILVLLAALVLPFQVQAGPADKARIVTQNAKPAECISRVAIRTINGKEKFVSPQGFDLEPGRYTLNGTVALDTSICKVARGNENTRIEPLEAEFEAGRTYYVGFDHRSTNRADWGLVVWKVE
jgi:hypothetical protein